MNRPATIYRDKKIVRLLRSGRNAPKDVARLMHIEVDVIYRAMKRIVSHETPTGVRRSSGR